MITYLRFCFVFLFLAGIVSAQDTTQAYHSKGDPKKCTTEITAFAFLPSVSGSIEVAQFGTDFQVSTVDLVKSLRGAAFIQAGIAKGKFMSQATYVFTRLESESASAKTIRGENVAMKVADLNMNVLQLNVGTRLPVHKKVLVDVFAGFRYNGFKGTAKITTITDSISSAEKKFDFWDPLFGMQVHYFPHPRVPVTVAADIGGLLAGRFSWKTSVNAGYSISPLIDLFAGFTAYGLEYTTETDNGRPATFSTVLYGITIGATMYLPKRFKDPTIFKKSKTS